jgi:hypothetical protein
MAKKLPPPGKDGQDKAYLEELLQAIEEQRSRLGDAEADKMLAAVRARMEELEQDGSQAESPDGSPKQDSEPKDGQGGGRSSLGAILPPAASRGRGR